MKSIKRKKNLKFPKNIASHQEESDAGHIDELIREKVRSEYAGVLQLEHFIKDETAAATKKVYLCLAVISFAIALSGFFYWDVIAERVAVKAAEKVANEHAIQEAKKIVASNVTEVLKEETPRLVEEIVPPMIEKTVVESTEKVKIDLLQFYSNQIRRAEQKVELIPVMARARKGDRLAFDQLKKVLKENGELSDFVEPGVGEVEEIYKEKRLYGRGKSIRLNTSDGRILHEEDYVDIVYGDNDWNCDGGINHLAAYNKKEFVAIFVHVVENTKRLDSVYLAVDAIQKLTGKSFSPIGITEVRDWWTTAKDKKEYHSPHETLYKLNKEFNRCLSTGPTNKTYVAEYIWGLKDLLNVNPNFKPAHKKMLFALSFGDYDANTLGEGEIKKLYKVSLARCRPYDFVKPEMYFISQLYYDILSGESFKNVQEYLDKCPSLEVILKEGKYFNSDDVKALKVNWPSDRKSTTTKVSGNSVEDLVHKRESLDSTGGVGYVTVSIEKGKRVLTELPFKQCDGFSKETLSSKNSPAVLKGDAICWTIDLEEHKYVYDGDVWIDEDGKDSSAVEIPVGLSPITYERKEDKKTSLVFSGWMEFN